MGKTQRTIEEEPAAVTQVAAASTEAVRANDDDQGFVPSSSTPQEDCTGQDAARDGPPKTANRMRVDPQGTSRGSDPAGDDTSAAVTRTVRPNNNY